MGQVQHRLDRPGLVRWPVAQPGGRCLLPGNHAHSIATGDWSASRWRASRPRTPGAIALFDALYDSVIAQRRLGLNVVVDVGHHDDYSTPLGILDQVSERLEALPAYFIGVRCPVEVILDRRAAEEPGREGTYLRRGPDGAVPEPVLRWERAVHDPGIYEPLRWTRPRRRPRNVRGRSRLDWTTDPPTAFREICQRTRRR